MFRGLRISYDMNTNMINLTMLAKFISERYHIKIDLYKYLNTREFKTELYKVDTETNFNNFVYLLDFPDKHECKIGSTHDITDRYKKQIREENLKAVILVDNDFQTENELREALRKKYKVPTNKIDYFIYDSIDNVIKIFDKIVMHHKLNIKQSVSSLLDFSKIQGFYFKGIYGYTQVAEIIINKYLRNNSEINNWKLLLNVHDHEIPNTSLNIMKDTSTKNDYYFWFYKGYVFISDSKKPFFNASRIVNSISKVDKKERSLHKFLRDNKQFNRLREQFKSDWGYDGVEDRTNLSEPKLKGIYIHEYLIDSVIRWAYPQYELMTNVMNRELAKVIDSSASAEEKIKKIENLLKIRTIIKEDEIKLNIPKSEFNINDYIDSEALQMVGGGKTKEELEQKFKFIR